MVELSERALLARVIRRLLHDMEAVRVCRENSRWYGTLGRHYAVDLNLNTIVAQHVSLEDWAKEPGVI
jgi:hypothetical protein